MTIQQVTDRTGINPALVRAVIRQTGRENLADIANHGADAGYAGLTYYSDTVAFFKRHRALILELVARQADELDKTPLDMVAGFQCLAGRQLKRSFYGIQSSQDERENKAKLAEYYPSVSRCLYGGKLTDEDTEVANALTWFAAEEVARAFETAQEAA